MTLLISTISLGVVLPVLKEKQMLNTTLGQTLLLITVIADFATMILLTVYITMQHSNSSNNYLILGLFVFVVIAYYFLKYFAKGTTFEALTKGTIQIGTRGVFALILLFVVLAESTGAENILGAFLAGVIVSLLSPKKDFVHKLDSFGYGFLIPIFFVMVGAKLDIMSLLSDSKVLVLIPLLLLFIFLSKIIPMLIMKKWYSWKEVISSSLLLSSTLSLVIAAAAVALDLGIINESLNGALILVAIISCLIFPIGFNKLTPNEVKAEKKKLTIIGANHVTLPVSLDIDKNNYKVTVFSHNENKNSHEFEDFPLVKLETVNKDTLLENNAFDADIVVIGTNDDDYNIELSKHFKDYGVKRVIVKVEDPDKHNQLHEDGYTVYSSLNSTKTLLKGLIEYPSIVTMLNSNNDSIYEVVVANSEFEGTALKDLDFLGSTLILQIYRDNSPIIPNGNTSIQLGDRLLVNGKVEHLKEIKSNLE